MKSSVDSVEYWWALCWGWLVLLGIDPSTRYRGAVIGNLLYSLPVTPDVSCRPQQLQQQQQQQQQQLLYITCGLFSSQTGSFKMYLLYWKSKNDWNSWFFIQIWNCCNKSDFPFPIGKRLTIWLLTRTSSPWSHCAAALQSSTILTLITTLVRRFHTFCKPLMVKTTCRQVFEFQI